MNYYKKDSSKIRYSIVVPCKDEESTIKTVITKAKKILPHAEIIVVDNNSKDKTAIIARSCGAKIVKESIQGYGAALIRGFNESRGEYIIMCDADDTYDLLELPRLLKYVENDKNKSRKYDIIMGNRLNSKMKSGAMPVLHKYIGNPLLSLILRMMYGLDVKDTHSGLRIIRRESLKKLNLESTGMELASEMLIKASKMKMRIKEVEITYHPRIGDSKLNSFNDGWKHLKMMLLYSPNHLFLIPGLISFVIGLVIMILMLAGPIVLFGFKLDIHPVIFASLLTMLGYQMIMMWLYAKTYRSNILGEKDKTTDWINKNITLEKGIIFGGLILLIGLLFGAWVIYEWIQSSFGQLFELRRSIFALTLIMIGTQTIYSGFMISILGIKHTRNRSQNNDE